MNSRPVVLLVDDEPGVVKVVKKRLELARYEVQVARNGQEALQRARATAPDLIVLDLMLPSLSGFEVCALLKQDRRTAHIPIVIFSARAHERDERLARECGADGYVRKSGRAGALLEQIAACRSHPPAAEPVCVAGWRMLAQRLEPVTR